MTAEEKKELVKKTWTAFGKGDIKAAFANMDDNVSWLVPGATPGVSGLHRGKDAILKFMEGVGQLFPEGLHSEIRELTPTATPSFWNLPTAARFRTASSMKTSTASYSKWRRERSGASANTPTRRRRKRFCSASSGLKLGGGCELRISGFAMPLYCNQLLVSFANLLQKPSLRHDWLLCARSSGE